MTVDGKTHVRTTLHGQGSLLNDCPKSMNGAEDRRCAAGVFFATERG